MPFRLSHGTPAVILFIAGSTQSLSAGPFGAAIELSSLNGTNGFVINGISIEDRCGRSVSCAGDINGDGVDDLIIGAHYANPLPVFNIGASYVVFGGAGIGSAGALELSTLDGTNGFVCSGINGSDLSGFSVSSAGDVNDDGLDDLLIGATGANGTRGECYVVFGAPGVGAGGFLELSSLDGANGFAINGIDVYDRAGWSISEGGDINGDGVDDLIFGARHILPSGHQAPSEVYVVFGATDVGAGGNLPLASLDGDNGFAVKIVGSNLSNEFIVSSAGDINADGLNDLVIGEKRFSMGGQTAIGRSYVVFGSSDTVAGGVFDLASLDGTNGFLSDGIDAFDRSGVDVDSAGDVNGDGVSDIIIGAFGDGTNGVLAGASYVVFGEVGIGSGGTLNLSSLDGTNGYVCNGTEDGERSGSAVSSAGDVNGDGIDDFVIGAWSADPNGIPAAGKSYVVFGGAGVGSSGAIELSMLNGNDGFVCNGIAQFTRSGYSVSSAGDMNGDGIDDLAVGAPWISPNGTKSGGVFIVFGRTDCPGDLNIDGVVDTADLGILIGQFNSAEPGADINNDGTVDTADLGALIANFGVKCS